MNNMIKNFMIIAAIVATSCLVYQPVLAFDQTLRGGVDAAKADEQPSNLIGEEGIFKRITNIMLFAIGVLSVIMLIVGGMHYVISGGKKESVTTAKNTILYAIVGLIIALMAYAIINFILGVFTESGGYSPTNV